MRTMVEPPIPALQYCATHRLLGPEHWKCRAISSLFVTLAYPDLEDDEAGTELPDDAAAREFAAKVMRGLVDQREGGDGGQGGRAASMATTVRCDRAYLPLGTKQRRHEGVPHGLTQPALL